MIFAVITPLISEKVHGRNNFLIIGNFFIHSGYWIIIFYILFLVSRIKNTEVKVPLNVQRLIEIIATIGIIYFVNNYMDKNILFVFCIVLISNVFIESYKKTSLVLAFIMVLSIIFMLLKNEFLINRINSYYIHQGNCHQLQQCLNSFEYGGLFGIGFNKTQRSFENGDLLPLSLGHSSFGVVVEHFGIIGAIILISLFLFLLYYGILIYFRQHIEYKSKLLILMMIPILVWNSVHILNCTNLFPFGSMLSFFSSSRDLILFTMIYFGFVYKFSKE